MLISSSLLLENDRVSKVEGEKEGESDEKMRKNRYVQSDSTSYTALQHNSICYNAYFYMHTQINEKQKEKAKYRMFSFWEGRKI